MTDVGTSEVGCRRAWRLDIRQRAAQPASGGVRWTGVCPFRLWDRRKKSRLSTAFFSHLGGGGGIRTHDTGLSPYASLAGKCLRPLGHASSQLLTVLLVVAECTHINGHTSFGQGSTANFLKKLKLFPTRTLYAGRVRPAPCISRRSGRKS